MPSTVGPKLPTVVSVATPGLLLSQSANAEPSARADDQ